VLAGDQHGHVVIGDPLAIHLYGGARLKGDELVFYGSGLLPYIALEQVVVDSAQSLLVPWIGLCTVRLLDTLDGLEVVKPGILLQHLGDILLAL
jgi:hypothetical protein